MPSPICEVKDGAGAYQATTSGVDVTPTNTVTIRLADQAGVNTWSIACATTDDLSDAATVTASLTIDALNKTATFTAPSAGRAYRFQSRINGGVDVNGVAQSSYTTTFCVYTLTAGGLRVHAVDETTEGGAFGWGEDLNSLIRNPGSTTPGGSDNQFQYNNGGTMSGTVGAIYNESTNRAVFPNGIEFTDGANTMIVDGTPTGARTLTLPDATTTLVGHDATQTLTNKTIDASSNTVTNLSASNVSSGTLARARGGSGHSGSVSAMGALDVDWTLSNVFTKTLASGGNTLTFSNAASGMVIMIRLTSHGSGSTVTWPAAVKWAGGTEPTQSTPSKTDVYTVMYDGTDYFGSYVQDFS